MRDGAFTALMLLLMSGASAQTVPPPTNVTVSCQEFTVAVRWDGSNQQPGTIFSIHLRGSSGWSSVSETTDHHYDLSSFIWSSEQHYMDGCSVTVAAIRGGRRSKAVASKTFSFNSLKTTDILCQLVFPAVDVEEDDSGATVSFANPFQSYRELRQASKPNNALFEFIITLGGREVEGECTVKQEVCKCDITFPEDVEKCVRLRGFLLRGGFVGQVLFRDTGNICVGERYEVHVIMLIVLLAVTGAIVTVVTCIICRFKAWTLRTPEKLPKSLDLGGRKQGHYDAVSDKDVVPEKATVQERGKTLSVSSEEENSPSDSLPDSSASSDFNYKLDTDSVRTECLSMDLGAEAEREEEEEDRESVSPYDCPHVLQVDMGDGEMVSGYTDRK